MTNAPLLESLSDDELIAETKRLVAAARVATAALLRSLMEIDTRRLYLREGCSSFFTYCTHVLHLAEGAAYNRIEAARIARRFPVVLDALASGRITLTTIRLLAPHLSDDNLRELIAAAEHKSKRDIELLIATIKPKPVAPTILRKRLRVLVASHRGIASRRWYDRCLVFDPCRRFRRAIRRKPAADRASGPAYRSASPRNQARRSSSCE